MVRSDTDHGENGEARGVRGDNSSPGAATVGQNVQAGAPYRGSREALAARREALRSELALIERATVREAELRQELKQADELLAAMESGRGTPGRGFGAVGRRLAALGLAAACGTAVGLAAGLASWEPTPRAGDAVEAEAPAAATVGSRPVRVASAASTDPWSDAATAARLVALGEAHGIRRVGEATWEIASPTHAEGPLAPGGLQLRVLPHEARGESVGVRVFGVRPGSVAEVLGLQDGDLVRRVNGQPIAGVEQSWEAYQNVRESGIAVVEIERAGAPRALVYRFVES